MKENNILDEMGNVSIVDNINEANFITHSGSFHTDELFCTALFSSLFEKVNLYRTRNIEGMSEQSIIFDVGNGEFDHHKSLKYRENGIPYAAFGLVWQRFGRDYLNRLNCENIETVFSEFDERIISHLDSVDNGYNQSTKSATDITTIVEHLNPINSGYNENEQFLTALSICDKVLRSEVLYLNSMIKSKISIDKFVNESNGGIMIMDSRIPWEENLITSNNPKASEILYVIRPSKEGETGFSINAVPIEVGSFEDRLPFPEEWRGLDADSLKKVSKVSGIKFCHKNGFLCIADTLEDAINVAKKSIENNRETILRR